jgi:DNA-binding transcriptional MerR regulator
VPTYTIGEVAERSGFTTSALRYYEGIGLVEPVARNENGYRVYDDRTVARLSFVARAKALGCSLAEITDLLAIWDDGACAPVQGRFHELVTGKIGDAQRQLAELAAFTAQLQAAASRLGREPADGPCDANCACLSAEPSAEPSGETAGVPLTMAVNPAGPRIVCTLDAGAMPERVEDWQAVLAHARARRTVAAGGLRIELDDDVDVGEVARLIAAEHECCSFFSFALTVDGRGRALEVRAPDAARDLVDALFGRPS